MELIKQKFSFYQKLHIATLVEKRYKHGVFMGESRQYYEALSSILGRCGHRHHTYEAAEPCLAQMQQMMKSRRHRQGNAKEQVTK